MFGFAAGAAAGAKFSHPQGQRRRQDHKLHQPLPIGGVGIHGCCPESPGIIASGQYMPHRGRRQKACH